MPRTGPSSWSTVTSATRGTRDASPAGLTGGGAPLGAVDRAAVTTGPGSETAVAGLPLAVRAVLALSEAGFSTVSLVAHGRPTWAAEPLARRGIAVQWMGAPSGEPADCSDIDNGLVLVLAGDVLLDAAAGSALRKASAGPVRNGEGRLVGVVCRPPDVPQYLGRPHLWACAPGRGSGSRR